MKLEVGKYYKSRNNVGWKCVYKHVSTTKIPFLCVNEHGVAEWFASDGLTPFSQRDDENDLIVEAIEPVKHEVEVYFQKYEDGFISANICDFTPKAGWTKIAKVKVRFTEGEGL